MVHFIYGAEAQALVQRALPEMHFMGWMAAIVGACVYKFQRLEQTHGLAIPTLHYDQLMKRPVEVTAELFHLLGLPAGYEQMALAALQHDTQKGTILSNIAHGGVRIRRMTGQDVHDINMALTLMGVPDMNTAMQLDNAVTGEGRTAGVYT